ncbi:MAG: hypothetical protein KF760_33155 [Candidatus Eremiobacteraeota bacterium]|nr:hypothetical protein [Candidatus Eremiobacteraeota bacterium]MCW5870191.1 hypothetical protein [Candidatus Eremiobacteraeota bacterium]
MIENLLKEAGGAGLQLAPGQAPLLVRPGGVEVMARPKLSREEFARILETVRDWGMVQEGEAEVGVPGLGRCLVRSRPGWLSLERLPSELPGDLESLNLPQVLADLLSLPQGLVLLGGQRQSGLSTTLACLLEIVLRHGSSRRVLLCGAHPYVHSHGRGLLLQSENLELGRHFEVVFTPLPADPRICIQLVEGGALLLATMRAPHTANMVDQLQSLLPPAWLARLQTALKGLYCQRLAGDLLPVTEFVQAELAGKWLAAPGPRDYPKCLEKQKGSWSLLHSLQEWIHEEKLTPEEGEAMVQSWS